MSTYAEPDTAELNYHAGTATCSLAQCMITIHTGVQYVDDHEADVVTAILLIISCLIPTQDLSKICIDHETASKLLIDFLDDININQHLTKHLSSKQFSKPRTETVKLHCFCLTPWIDGSTSAAMYEKEQKEFNAYHCSKCNDWFHKRCLKKCNISVPRQNATFVCSKCSIPATIPWQHHEFTNTCTADNFLTIVLLHCNQNLQFISKIGNSEIEKSLKAVMLMQKGSVKEGKSLILRAVQARLNFQYSNGKYDCYGSEHSSLLCLFSHVWKLTVKQKCMSPHCPQKNKPTIRCQTSFHFASCVFI